MNTIDGRIVSRIVSSLRHRTRAASLLAWSILAVSACSNPRDLPPDGGASTGGRAGNAGQGGPAGHSGGAGGTPTGGAIGGTAGISTAGGGAAGKGGQGGAPATGSGGLSGGGNGGAAGKQTGGAMGGGAGQATGGMAASGGSGGGGGGVGQGGQGGADPCPGIPAPAAPKLGRPARGVYTGSLHAPSRMMTLRPTFSWVPVASNCGPLKYQIQLDDSCLPGQLTSCSFPSPEVDVSGLETTTFSPSTDLKVSTTAPVGAFYSWRTRACDAANRCSPWTEVRYLHVGRVREDINGDGYGDLLPFDSDGHLQIFPGGPQFDVAMPATTISSVQSNAHSRFAGDVNGDGFSDVVLFTGYATTAGPVPVLYLGGANIKTPSPVMLTKDAGGPSAYLGAGMPGDWNGDGFADIFIEWSYFQPMTTQIRIHLGAASISATSDLVLNSPLMTTSAPGIADSGIVGDLDGDGFEDLAVLWADLPGQMSQVSAFRGGTSPDDVPDLMTIQKGSATDSLAGAGDLDADGFDDFIVTSTAAGFTIVRGSQVLEPKNRASRNDENLGPTIGGFDLDRNGISEFILSTSDGAKVFQGLGSSPIPGAFPVSNCSFSAWSDYDGDNNPDLVSACSPTQIVLYMGDKSFSPQARYIGGFWRVVR